MTPSPWGHRALETGTKEARAIDSSGSGRDDEVPGGQGGIRRSGTQMGGSESGSLFEPDFAGNTSTSEGGSPDVAGAPDPVHNPWTTFWPVAWPKPPTR